MLTKAKRWLPLAGTAVLALAVVLRVLGYGDAATAIEGVGGTLGVTAQSPVGIGELTAAVAAVTGVVLKVVSEVRKARTRPAA